MADLFRGVKIFINYRCFSGIILNIFKHAGVCDDLIDVSQALSLLCSRRAVNATILLMFLRHYHYYVLDIKVKNVQVYSLISSISSDFFYPLVTGPVHSCAISTTRRTYSPAAILAH